MRACSSLARASRRPMLTATARRATPNTIAHRTLFWPFRRSPPTPKPTAGAAAPSTPTLAQNDLFHPLSQSPFPALVDKANRIKNVSLCPTSLEKHDERTRPAFDCPDCGWPTHASQSLWAEGREEHQEYCGRLREVNEDEHDIRSGRPMNEFENLPGECQCPWVKIECRADISRGTRVRGGHQLFFLGFVLFYEKFPIDRLRQGGPTRIQSPNIPNHNSQCHSSEWTIHLCQLSNHTRRSKKHGR
jgi:hypothetical protein